MQPADTLLATQSATELATELPTELPTELATGLATDLDPVADETAVQLPPSLDLTSADALQGDLQSRIAGDSALLLDGRDVERVSTACLQVLVAAAASARTRGVAFRIAAPSARLRDAVRELGLGSALGMEEA